MGLNGTRFTSLLKMLLCQGKIFGTHWIFTSKKKKEYLNSLQQPFQPGRQPYMLLGNIGKKEGTSHSVQHLDQIYICLCLSNVGRRVSCSYTSQRLHGFYNEWTSHLQWNGVWVMFNKCGPCPASKLVSLSVSLLIYRLMVMGSLASIVSPSYMILLLTEK